MSRVLCETSRTSSSITFALTSKRRIGLLLGLARRREPWFHHYRGIRFSRCTRHLRCRCRLCHVMLQSVMQCAETLPLLNQRQSLPRRFLCHQLLARCLQLSPLVADGNFGELLKVVGGCSCIPSRLRRPRGSVQRVKTVRGDLQHILILRQRFLRTPFQQQQFRQHLARRSYSPWRHGSFVHALFKFRRPARQFQGFVTLAALLRDPRRHLASLYFHLI